MASVRINKYLSECGVCSRREADRRIEAGEVLVNGQPAVPGAMVSEEDEITCAGEPVRPTEEKVLLAVCKPDGIVCTTAYHKGEKNIVDMIGWPSRIYPIGRLDKNSEGLILMTNQGELSERLLRSRYGHEKEYEVTLRERVTLPFLQQMREGVPILDTVTLPCQVIRTGSCSFRIILTQGLNRQIRRMCEALGFHVVTLKRIRVANILLGDLKPGEYRRIEGEERDRFLALMQEPEKGKEQSHGR